MLDRSSHRTWRRISLRKKAPLAVAAAVVLAATAAWAADEGLDLTGEVRLRLRNVASPDTGDLRGTYGETLLEGFSLKHRLVLEASYPLGADIHAGGMLRITNEGKDVLLGRARLPVVRVRQRLHRLRYAGGEGAPGLLPHVVLATHPDALGHR